MRTPPAPRPSYPRLLAPLLLASSLLLAACGGAASAARTKGAPVVTVAVGLWPLAQAAEAVGQGNVRVLDVVPAGQDPMSYRLTSAQRRRVRTADLVIRAGSQQPSLTAAASGASRVLDVGGGDVWLSPYRMETVSRAIERALVAVDPKAKATFANGNDNEQALLSSLDQDFESTLGVCPSQTMVTSDAAFSALNGRYPVHVVGVDGAAAAPLRPDAATLAREAATVRRTGVKTVYRDVWQPVDGLIPVQGETGVGLKTIDPLTGVPPQGWPQGGRTYFDLMEYDLRIIAGALDCPNPGQGG